MYIISYSDYTSLGFKHHHELINIFAVSIPLLLKCLKKQSEVLHRHNLELAQTNDALTQAYAMQGSSQDLAM